MGCINSTEHINEDIVYGMNPKYLPNKTIFLYNINLEIKKMKDLYDFPYKGQDAII